MGTEITCKNSHVFLNVLFYRRNNLKLLGPGPKNVTDYCCKGFPILLDQFCAIQIESRGSELSGHQTEAFSCGS